ncbi:MAG TPA: hypothetical protein PKE05_04875 [Microthrixaceae bacterium]|nr:hypothetical protein [Microthrixaceae bacterium]
MTDEEYGADYRRAKQAIVKMLEESGGAAKESAVITDVARTTGLDESIVARVTWDMINDHETDYAPQFKMRLVKVS